MLYRVVPNFEVMRQIGVSGYDIGTLAHHEFYFRTDKPKSFYMGFGGVGIRLSVVRMLERVVGEWPDAKIGQIAWSDEAIRFEEVAS